MIGKRKKTTQVRTAEDRERARAERARRRAEREGRPLPPAETEPTDVAEGGLEQLADLASEVPSLPVTEQPPAVSPPTVLLDGTEDASPLSSEPSRSLEAEVPESGLQKTFEHPAQSSELPEAVSKGPTSAQSEGVTGRTAQASTPITTDSRAGDSARLSLRTPVPTDPKANRRSVRRKTLAVFAVLFIGIVGWFAWYFWQPLKGEGGDPVRVVVPEGSSARQVGDLLERQEVVSSGLVFSLRAALAGELSNIKPGRYILAKDMGYSQVLDRLSEGPPPSIVTVTVPEGRSRKETAKALRGVGLQGDYISATANYKLSLLRSYGAPKRTRTLEGLLFPATYELPRGASVKRLVNDQLDAFKSNFAKLDTRSLRRKGIKPYQIVTVASMVEREAQVAKERRLISAVIYNRLSRGIPLGIDATVRYATDNWTKPLTQSELSSNSPYNTRIRKGLPPTPIGSPGLAALKAAAKPAKVGYLYYVVKPNTCGEHAFSSSYAEFQQDVQRYQKARERLGGKAPTKCP